MQSALADGRLGLRRVAIRIKSLDHKQPCRHHADLRVGCRQPHAEPRDVVVELLHLRHWERSELRFRQRWLSDTAAAARQREGSGARGSARCRCSSQPPPGDHDTAPHRVGSVLVGGWRAAGSKASNVAGSERCRPVSSEARTTRLSPLILSMICPYLGYRYRRSCRRFILSFFRTVCSGDRRAAVAEQGRRRRRGAAASGEAERPGPNPHRAGGNGRGRADGELASSTFRYSPRSPWLLASCSSLGEQPVEQLRRPVHIHHTPHRYTCVHTGSGRRRFTKPEGVKPIAALQIMCLARARARD